MPKTFFPKVKEAREALANKALELFELQMQIARDALANGDFEEANKAVQFLMEHMPDDANGTSLLDSSVDKAAVKTLPAGPAIQIGIALGPKQPTKSLPPVEVIDVTDDPTSN